MKKILPLTLAIALIFSGNLAFAINLDNIAGAIESATSGDNGKNNSNKKSTSPIANIQNDLFGKVEEKADKIIGKIENKIDKFDKKFDAYESKIDKAEKATDRIIAMINSLDSSKVKEYANMVKYTLIGMAIFFMTMTILLIAVFVQLLKVNCQLKKTNKN
jgi:peptidoglycan hydrolase CwlO-like protein